MENELDHLKKVELDVAAKLFVEACSYNDRAPGFDPIKYACVMAKGFIDYFTENNGL